MRAVGSENICLILDSLAAHRSQSVSSALADLNIRVLYVPGGLTAVLQPIDLGINAPFKHWVRENWSASYGTERSTMQEKRVFISRLVDQSWQQIRQETVSNSFACLLRSNESRIMQDTIAQVSEEQDRQEVASILCGLSAPL